MVDGANQRSSNERLELMEFHSLPDVKRLTIGDLHGRLYEGVRQSRTLIVCDAYVLDLFQVCADGTRELAWMTHVDGESIECNLSEWKENELPSEAPWKWLQSPESAPLSGQYTETFDHKGKRFQMDVTADGDVEVARCGFPRSDAPDCPAYAMRSLRCNRAKTWYLALYRTGESCQQPVRLSLISADMDKVEICVDWNGKAIKHLAPRLDP